MHLFYTPDLDTQASHYQLSEEESKHAIRVLRLANTDVVQLIDGKGGLYQAEIIDAHPKRCTLEIKSREFAYQKPN